MCRSVTRAVNTAFGRRSERLPSRTGAVVYCARVWPFFGLFRSVELAAALADENRAAPSCAGSCCVLDSPATSSAAMLAGDRAHGRKTDIRLTCSWVSGTKPRSKHSATAAAAARSATTAGAQPSASLPRLSIRERICAYRGEVGHVLRRGPLAGDLLRPAVAISGYGRLLCTADSSG